MYSCNTTIKNDSKVFKYNESAGVFSLDPAFAKSQSENWIVSQLYCGLVQLDDSLQIEKSIAKSWSTSDNKTFVFTLRDDVYFHNIDGGTRQKVIASDVVFSFRRLIDANIASPGAWLFNDKIDHDFILNFDSSARIKSAPFEAINDTTFVLRIKKAFPPLLSLLAMPYCYVLPQSKVELNTDLFFRNPIGSGPFKFKLWEKGVRMVLLKNEMFFERDVNNFRLPYLDAINIDFNTNKQAAFMGFVSGKYHFYNGLDASFRNELLNSKGELRDKYQNKIKLQTSPFLNTEYIGIQLDVNADINKNSPLLNQDFRKALNYSIDKKMMIQYLRNNIGFAAENGFVPPALFNRNSVKGYNYNQEMAKKLLEKAGYKNGVGVSKLEIHTTADYTDIMVFVSNEWAKIGIKSSVEIHPSGFLRQMRNDLKINLFRGSWIADYSDAENYLACFYSKNHSPMGPNYTHYTNVEFDELYELSIQEKDGSRRSHIYKSADSIIMENAAIIPLYYDKSLRLTQLNVEGLKSHPMNWLVLKNVEIH